ncbi:MAG TPA: hypothetical protein PLK80_07080 [bacterium]|nr:hypothetical protein [bacterium]HPI76483.1 hypothetical protein [bacterium]HPN95072.1 hypothetical protein [bacterium]
MTARERSALDAPRLLYCLVFDFLAMIKADDSGTGSVGCDILSNIMRNIAMKRGALIIATTEARFITKTESSVAVIVALLESLNKSLSKSRHALF